MYRNDCWRRASIGEFVIGKQRERALIPARLGSASASVFLHDSLSLARVVHTKFKISLTQVTYEFIAHHILPRAMLLLLHIPRERQRVGRAAEYYNNASYRLPYRDSIERIYLLT